jgi:hypothetical protein
MSKIDLATANLDDIILATIGDGTQPDPAVLAAQSAAKLRRASAITQEMTPEDLEAAHAAAELLPGTGK